MPGNPVRIVLDTNVMVRGIGSCSSPSGKVLDLCDRRLVIPLVSRPVLAEYREVLNDPQVAAYYPSLNPARVEMQIQRLTYLGDMLRTPRVRFAFPRDPKDAKFIELAIAAAATTIVTCDRDLLSLPWGHTEASRRFRQRLPLIQLVRPDIFLNWFHQRAAN